jgi:putative ABC transport system permease protein
MSGPVPGGDRQAAGVRYRQTLSRWRLAFRLARRDLHRHTGRAVLIALMVALPVAAGSFLVTALESNEPYAPGEVEAELGPGLQAKIEGIGGPIEQFRQPDSERWFWDPVGWSNQYEYDPVTMSYEELEQDIERLLPDGDRLVRALKGQVRLEDGDDIAMSVAVQTDFTEPDVAARIPVLEGRLPRAGEIAVTEHHRDLGFDLGDTVEVSLRDGTTNTVTISGIAPRYIGRISPVLLPEPGPLVPPEEATSAGPDFPLWYVTGDEPVTWSDVQHINAAGAFVTSREVLLDPPPPPPTPSGGPGPGYISWGSVAVIVALIVVGLLEAIWLIGPAFAVGARRDTRSLALLAVNGAPAPALRAVMLARGLLTGVAGSVAGLGVGIAAAAVLVQAFPDRLPALRLPGLSLAAVLLVGVLVAIASAWPPARRAARADVVTVLAGRRPAVSTPRRPTVVGAAAAVGGVVLAVVAGAQERAIGLAAGIVTADLGLILACGGIVALLGRVTHRLPWAWRFALRDAARYRARTVPAIAAVLVAMAGASAALTYLDAEERVMRPPQYEPWASIGTVALTSGYEHVFAEDVSEPLQEIVDRALPDAGPVLAVPTVVSLADGDEGASSRRGLVDLTVHLVDTSDSGDGPIFSLGPGPSPVVTDGSDQDLLRALGVPQDQLDDVAAALADGRLPLPSSHVDENGNARVSVAVKRNSGLTGEKEMVLPAVAVGSPAERIPNLPIVPAALLDELGAETAIGAYLVENPSVPSDRQLDLLQTRANAELVGFDADRTLRVQVESGDRPEQYVSPLAAVFATPGSHGQPVMSLALALAAVFLALVGTWSAVALSAVDARPDLATLAAVGAGPSARRRVVAAQAATISVIGSVLGLVAGTLIGVGWTLLTGYPLAVPWPRLAALAVAVPVLATVAAWAVTSTRVAPARRWPS